MLNLRLQYMIGTAGFILMSFGGGMLTFAGVTGYPQFSALNLISVAIFAAGIFITIKMLSTMKKIELLVEEDENESLGR